MEASALRRQRAGVLPRSRRLLATLGDDRLVEQIRRGNVVAFEVVYDRHYRGILSFCRHMLGSREEAEDAVQQTFASAYTDLQSNSRDIRLKAWLYTIARNRCLSTLRARREQAAELTAEDLPTAGLTDEVQQRADLQELLQDLRELPDDQREALVLFEIGDLSQSEVANVIGVEPVKVKALVFQARSALIENREARAIPCAEIREQLATASGGALRRAPLRRHLKACEGCREYRDQVRDQRRALAALLPVVPTVGLKQSVLAAIGFGGGAGGGGLAAGGGVATGAATATTAAGGSGATGLLASFGGVGAAKLAVAATLGVGGLVGGGVAVERGVTNDRSGTEDAQAATEPVETSVAGAATGNPGNGNPGNGSPAVVGNAGDDPSGDKDDKRRDDDKKSDDRKDEDDGDSDDDGNSGKGDEKGSGRSGGSEGSKGEARRHGGRRSGRGRGNGNRGRSGSSHGNKGGKGRGNSGSNGNHGTGNNGNGGGATQPAPPAPVESDDGDKKGGRGTASTPTPPEPAEHATPDTGDDVDGEKLVPPVDTPLPQ